MSLWGASQQKKAAAENKQFQIDQQNLAYERSMPWSSQGPAGNVDFDPETRQMIQSLSPEYQAMMDGWLGTSGMANTELQGMLSDPYKMEQEQFKRFEDLNADSYNETRLRAKEHAIATGRGGGTQGYYDQLAVDAGIDKSRLGGQMAAINTGMDYRNMLRAESLGFGGAAQDVAGMLNPQADLGRMVGQGSKVSANMSGVRDAGANYADTKSGFWSNMASQAGEYDWSKMLGGGGGSQGGSQQTYSSMFDQKGYTPKL